MRCQRFPAIAQRIRTPEKERTGSIILPGPAPLIFVTKSLGLEEVMGKKVLEVGSNDREGYVRKLVSAWRPSAYTGIDITPGEGVDVVCGAEEVVKRFGKRAFDVIISAEVLEHIRDWRGAIQNMKDACSPNGVIVITTRSPGFPFHSFPADYWRFDRSDVESIFSDCKVESLEEDFERPGIFAKIRVPETLSQRDLSSIFIYSVVVGRKIIELKGEDATLGYKVKIAHSRFRDALYGLGHWIFERV